MAPKKRTKTTQEAGTSSQAPSRAPRTTRTSRASARGNAPHPLGLLNPVHIARYNCLSNRTVVATRYYDEDLLVQLGLLEDIRWLFARGGMEHFIERKDHTYRDLTLEFLSTLHVEVTSGAQCQAGYISFYLLGQFYEMNLGSFNEIFGFPPSLDVPLRAVPRQFNPNAFWFEITGNYNYNTSSCKCTQIRNPCIRVAQRILASSIFARDDSVNVPRLSELYFLSCMLQDERLDPGSFLARQLYSAATSTKGRIVVGGIVTSIARFLGIEPNPDDRVSGSERLDKAAFELMGFCRVEAGRLCWIYPGGRLMPLPNIERTTLHHNQNLSYMPNDDELAQPAPPVPPPSFPGPSSSSRPSYHHYPDLEDTLRSIQDEQASLRAYVASEHAALRDFVQERHDELREMIASQNQYFQDFRACLQTWRDWHLSQPHPPSSPPPPPPF
jgi:hypothetical protein